MDRRILFVAVALALISMTTAAPQGYPPRYLGCYIDTDTDRAVPDDRIDSSSMTHDYCFNYCRDNGKRYVAMQNSNACWCGEDEVLYDKHGEAPGNECYMECTGDSSQICGGAWRNSVFDLWSNPYPPQYLGCYIDTGTDRAVPDDRIDSSSMTHDYCFNYCRDNGKRYVALQNSNACWCGAYEVLFDKHGEAPGNECYMECTGDSSQICGGAWRNSVFDLWRNRYPPQYLGCYIDTDTDRAVPDDRIDSSSMTHDYCFNYCRDNGKRYVAMQNSNACWCGAYEVLFDKHGEAPGNECYMECTGDSSQICGAGWRNSVFDLWPNRYPPQYLGCYIDTNTDRAVPDDRIDSSSMTHDYCFNYCRNNGKRYVALQNSNACWCGEDKVLYDKHGEAPGDECDMECTGNSLQICGAGWRNSVFDLWR